MGLGSAMASSILADVVLPVALWRVHDPSSSHDLAAMFVQRGLSSRGRPRWSGREDERFMPHVVSDQQGGAGPQCE
ncbi:MAG TPA: hypothetical protein VKF37_16140 [Chloroflexota bacterium]|nr:hypothetical protein [Chloroflexota bacterium]